MPLPDPPVPSAARAARATQATQADAATAIASTAAGLSPRLTWLFAIACGLCVANLYFAQPLVGPIAETLRLHAGLAGLVVTLTQLGYGTGLLLLVPLADVVENRRLILLAMAGAVLGLVAVALSNSAALVSSRRA